MIIRIEITVKGDAAGMLRVVKKVLDAGTFQDEIAQACADYEVEAEIDSVTESGVS